MRWWNALRAKWQQPAPAQTPTVTVETDGSCPLCDEVVRTLNALLQLAPAAAQRDGEVHVATMVLRWATAQYMALHEGDPRPLFEVIVPLLQSDGISVQAIRVPMNSWMAPDPKGRPS